MKVRAVDLDGLALVWAVATGQGFRKVRLCYGYHAPEKAHLPTQVMVSEKKDSCYAFSLGGAWFLDIITLYEISPAKRDQKCWVAFNYGADGHLTGRFANGATPVEAVARFYLQLRGADVVELPKELEALWILDHSDNLTGTAVPL